MQSLKEYIKELIKSRKPFLVVSIVYLLFCFSVFLYFVIMGNLSTAGTALVYSTFVLVVYLFEQMSDLKIPAVLLGLFLFIPLGAILGSNFDFYVIFPWFDDLLHTLSGFIFAAIGFGIFRTLSKDIKDKKSFNACLLGGLFFSLSCALVWELYEYFASTYFGFDMQEDTLINSFSSYYFSGTHEGGMIIQDITKTIIYYGDGKQYVINGGYLDTGLYDTLGDLIVCLIGSIVYTILVLAGKKHKLYDKFCPVINYEIINNKKNKKLKNETN